MNTQTFLNEIEEIIEVDKNSLNGTEVLKDLEDWDSLALMGFIAMVDTNMDVTLEAEKINACVTVNDLVVLVADYLDK